MIPAMVCLRGESLIHRIKQMLPVYNGSVKDLPLETRDEPKTDEFMFFKRQFRKVAWLRACGLALAIGVIGAVGASEELENPTEAFGFVIGYGGVTLVMNTATTIICAKGCNA